MDWGLTSQIATLLAGGALASSALALVATRERLPAASRRAGRGGAASARGTAAGARGEGDTPEDAVFLLRGEDIVDATAAGRLLLARHKGGGTDLERLLDALTWRFPTLPVRLSELSQRRRIDLTAADGSARLEAEWGGGLARLRIVEIRPAPGSAGPGADGGGDAAAAEGDADMAALIDELEELRAVVEHATVPIWRTGLDGTVAWANRAYLDLAQRCGPEGDVPRWPPPRLFDALAGARMDAGGRRAPLTDRRGGEVMWFRCEAREVGNGTLYTAYPDDGAVAAERSLSTFVQTMSSTFASLTVGLAIFDRRRELTLFNPALMELTELPGDFLAGRPSLAAFLDRLRDQRMIPEPRDYRGWRQQLAELEAAARDGTYSEIWPLPDGRTYRVEGRPHNDGAIAFVIEDISSEITLTRRFRAQIETGQAVLDTLEEAIAVFSPTGIMILSNRAYDELWKTDPMHSVGEDVTILDATRTWHAACLPTPVWGDARDFAAGLGERAAWEAEVRLRDGTPLACRFEPLAGGAILAGFRRIAPLRPARGEAHAAAVSRQRAQPL